jgi:leucine dehydrogenase
VTKPLAKLTEGDYEQVVFCNQPDAGLRAIIAIHDTTLGPALGGVRMRPYRSEGEALEDVLRLARGMTYKASISGVDLGGGKSVIIGDPATDKTEALLRAMGRQIQALDGRYIAGQDIGTDSDDMAVIARETPHVTCVAESAGGGGDPSFATAFGVVAGIRAVLKEVRGADSLRGRTIAIQGVGHVGYFVAKYCHQGGAELVVSDLSEAAAERVRAEFGAEIVNADGIYEVECDVFSPCSVGAVVNDRTLPRLRCAGISGGANNVLAEDRHAAALAERGICYAPDYLVNSGGLIHCQAVLRGGGELQRERILERVGGIYDQTLAVFRKAGAEGITTAAAADRLAEERIRRARQHPL